MLGRNLGNYQVVSKIGEGGMGVVYLARHLTLGRAAAVKVLHPELASNQDVVSRFFNEARAATAVRNPSIVEVFDFGFLEDRSAYIVMEFLDGESLAARLRRGPSSIATTLIIVRAIARGLSAAHEHSIVHRDLKPDNIFLVPDPDLPGGERVKLLDFGIAKLASVGEASHTRTGAVMGTPTYMAPEQCRGAGSVDHRADLYALGCIAYEMLCGQPPFVADGAGEIIARHLYFQPQPPRQLRGDVPPDVDELVLRLLQKDPAARPATAADVVRAIDRLSAPLGVAARPGEAGPFDQLMARGLPAATRSEPGVTQVASHATVVATTLSGAAQSTQTSSFGTAPGGARLPLRFLAGAGAVVAVVVVLVVWARSGGGGANGSATGSAGSTAASPGSAVAAALPPASSAIAASIAPATVEPAPSSDAAAAPAAAPQSTTTTTTAAPEPSRPPASPTSTAPSLSASTASATSTTSTPPARSAGSSAIRSTHGKPAAAKSPSAAAKSPSSAAKSAAGDAARPADDGKDDEARSPARPVESACSRAAFAQVVNADAPGEAVVQAALTRLRRCKALMPADVYADVQRELIAKL